MVKKLDLEKCIWKHMSEDKNSTTFKDVDESHKYLAVCKYSCDGYDNLCDTYKRLGSLKTYQVKEITYN